MGSGGPAPGLACQPVCLFPAALRAEGPPLPFPRLHLPTSSAFLWKRPQHLLLCLPPQSGGWSLEPGLSSPFSDLLGPLGAQADEAGCSAQPSPERQPSPLEPRPVSPSAYMLRLPPPAGAYIQSEHSYQVGSALLWKRRAEAALDALDKAQRQLQACKRREQRLRLRLTKLQQERAREKRAQADARQTLKEHVQDFAMQLSSSMA